MKVYKKINIPARTKEVLDKRVCEICGQSDCFDSGYGYMKDTDVTHRYGSVDPDGGGSGKKIELDICHTCFENVLVPWVRGFGQTKVEYEDWEC